MPLFLNRNWFVDPFWSIFRGRGFDPSEGTTNTTLNGAVVQDATSLVVNSATGFVVGESIAVGSGNNWQFFTIAAIASTTFTVYPKVQTGGFLSGDNVNHAFINDTHPNGYTAYGQALSDMKMRRALVGANRMLPIATGTVGDMTATYTDARSVANVPVGWESLGTATFTATSYLSTDILPFARQNGGCKINAAAINDGMRTLGSISVTAGEALVVTAMCKHTAGTGFTIKVVDKSTPSTVLGQLSAVMGDRTLFNYFSLAQVHVPFTVPAGTTAIEIRVLATGTTDECYIDDVRLIADRQASSTDRYLFEDPGSATIAWIGDSWGANGGAAAFRAAFEARLGHSLASFANLSVSGNTLGDMLARFDTDVVPVAPQTLIVQYGSNDMTQGRDAGLMQSEADAMIARCQQHGFIPVFVCIVPNQSVLAACAQRTDQIRARVSLGDPVNNFRQMTLGAPIPMVTSATTFNAYTFVNTTDQIEWIFQVPDDQDNNTVTITQLGYRLNSVTGTSPVMQISLQGVTSAGNPDGTIKGGASPASATFTPAGTNTWNWVTLANPYTANRGDLLAIVISYSSGTLNGTNTPVIAMTLGAGTVNGLPYAIQNVAGTRTRQSLTPAFGFASASRGFGFPIKTISNVAYVNPVERAMRFILDAAFVSNYKIAGVRLNILAPASGSSAKVMLYQGTTVLQTATIPSGNVRSTVQQPITVWFQDATLATLQGGQEYRISLAPQDASIWVWNQLDFLQASDMAGLPGDGTWYLSTRSTGGTTAWTDQLTSRPLGEIIISRWGVPSPGIIVSS